MIAKNSHGLYIALMVIFCMIMVGCAGTKPATRSETRDIMLTWDDVPDATSYNIYLSDKPGVTKDTGIKISNVKNPHKVTDLEKGKKYYFIVTAVSDSNESDASEEISITIGQ